MSTTSKLLNYATIRRNDVPQNKNRKRFMVSAVLAGPNRSHSPHTQPQRHLYYYICVDVCVRLLSEASGDDESAFTSHFCMCMRAFKVGPIILVCSI
jgi:hypothetical protein